uniref:Protein NDNF n=1 Tax=Cyprinus carpio carpio TaxID=630221 RepID=A0A9J7X9F8_CYPCA
MALSWCLLLAMALFSGPGTIYALAPENEVTLHPTTWLSENRVTPVHLPKGHTRRLYFTLKKKADLLSVTVSPCAVPIEWSLAVRTLKDKPPKKTHWSSKKSMPEVWWRGSGREVRIYTYTGNAVDTYTGPAYAPASIYILRLKSNEQDTQVSAYLHEGPGPSGAFPELPSDPRVHTLGVGMTSVTLNWAPSSSVVIKDGHRPHHEYCVLVNHKHNYRNLCAAHEGIRKEIQSMQKRQRRDKQSKEIVWATLKDWWWRQPDALKDHESSTTDKFEDTGCVCRDIESAPSYLIQLQALDPGSSSTIPKGDSSKSKFCLKMQTSSAYHRRAVPVFPTTLQIKSFNKLRTCNSVTLAWMGTEERSLYCIYRRQIPLDSKHTSTDRCLDPESRPADERVLCKYFQELNPRRAVTTAVVSELEPGMLYVFDVYLMRRWGLPIKYHSKTVRTRSEC